MFLRKWMGKAVSCMCKNLESLRTCRKEKSTKVKSDGRSLALLSRPWEAFQECSLRLPLRNYTRVNTEAPRKQIPFGLAVFHRDEGNFRGKDYVSTEIKFLVWWTEICIYERYCASHTFALMLKWKRKVSIGTIRLTTHDISRLALGLLLKAHGQCLCDNGA